MGLESDKTIRLHRDDATRRKAPTGPKAVQVAAAAPADVDRYAAVKQLGQGGMGEVVLCRDEVIGREVAMKISLATVDDQDAAARFDREVRVQGQLEHPAVVPVYDFFQGDDAKWRFTMKRVKGKTLESILDGLRAGDAEAVAAYSTRKLLSAFSTVCLALAFAHARGVVHRDLKPGNIMLGEFGEVHVLDWGLAKIRGAAEITERAPAPLVSNDSARTQVGLMMGTPGYMAPEQALGQLDRIDERTDIYALGAILFEIVALVPLHEGSSLAELISSTLKGADARARTRAPDRAPPPELEDVCVRATALDPGDRYASALELHARVERYLEGDRNLEQRRTMAAEHVARARAAFERYKSTSSSPERTTALREAGAAVALDPTNRDASEVLLRLLIDVPEDVPDEAKAEFEQSSRVLQKSSRAGLFVQYLAWLGYAPVGLLLGVRNGTWLIALAVIIVLAIFGSYYLYRREASGQPPTEGAQRLSLGVFTVGSAFAALASGLVGPFFLVPQLAVTNVIAYVMFGERRYRNVAVVLSCAAVVLPWALGRLGVIANPYSFDGNAMTIHATATSLPAGITEILLLLAALGLVCATPMLLGRTRDHVDMAEKRLFLHAWSLRQALHDRGPAGPERVDSAGACTVAG